MPVVLSRGEAQRLLAGREGTPGLIARLLYGTGLRLMEGLRLRVKDVDFARNQIIVHDGKGFKDRVTMLTSIGTLITAATTDALRKTRSKDATICVNIV